MLSGVKLVDRADAEHLLKAEKRSKHKEKKKKHKKVCVSIQHAASWRY